MFWRRPIRKVIKVPFIFSLATPAYFIAPKGAQPAVLSFNDTSRNLSYSRFVQLTRRVSKRTVCSQPLPYTAHHPVIIRLTK